MPQHQIALFTFTLGRAESIGPQALRRLWTIASGSREVSVGRRESQWGDGNRPVYTLRSTPRRAWPICAKWNCAFAMPWRGRTCMHR